MVHLSQSNSMVNGSCQTTQILSSSVVSSRACVIGQLILRSAARLLLRKTREIQLRQNMEHEICMCIITIVQRVPRLKLHQTQPGHAWIPPIGFETMHGVLLHMVPWLHCCGPRPPLAADRWMREMLGVGTPGDENAAKWAWNSGGRLTVIDSEAESNHFGSAGEL